MKRPLRIALCCQQDFALLPLPAYRFWADYFRQAFAESGHETAECPQCNWAQGLLPLDRSDRTAWLDRTWATFIQWLKAEHERSPIDLVLTYLFPNQVEPSAVESMRRLGIPVVNFFCDNVREFRRVPTEFHGFDLHWVPEFKALRYYQAAALPHLNLPMPCWVPPAHRTPVARESLPITFIGTRDEQREMLFGEAIAKGLAVDLRGTGWIDRPQSRPAPRRARDPIELVRRQAEFARRNGVAAWMRKLAPQGARPSFDFSRNAKPSPAGDEYWTAVRESSVCLGVNRYPSLRFPADAPDTYSRLRDIEAPMAGACYLTEWTEGLDQMYVLGTEIETYRTADELVAKANLLAGDSTRRHALRDAGQARALRDHTIARSIELIAEKLSLT